MYGVTGGWPAGSAPPASSTRCWTSSPSSASDSGPALAGLIPIPEIQYLAYLHNAEDQLRGEAATLSFFSSGRFRNPMVVRMPGLAYQKGFGGHFHNDNGLAVLRDIPGLIVACPARADDAAAMLRSCVAAARWTDRCRCSSSRSRSTTPGICTRPATAVGWPPITTGRCALGRPAVPGRRCGPRHDHVRQRGADEPAGSSPAGRERDRAPTSSTCAGWRRCRSRTSSRAAREAGRVLVVDETRRTGGVGEGVITALVEHRFSDRWPASPARTPSSRWVPPPGTCC